MLYIALPRKFRISEEKWSYSNYDWWRMGDIERISTRWINVRDWIEIWRIDVLHRASILRKEQADKVYL